MVKIYQLLFLSSLACFSVSASEIDDLKKQIEKIEIQFEIIYKYTTVPNLPEEVRKEAQTSSINRLSEYLLDMQTNVYKINKQAIKPVNQAIIDGVDKFITFANALANFLKELELKKAAHLASEMKIAKSTLTKEYLVSGDRRKIRDLLVKLIDVIYQHALSALKLGSVNK